MTIFFSRTASIAPGKLTDAIAFARDVVKIAREVNGVELAVSSPIGGNPNRIRWSSSYANLAEFDAQRKKLTSSPEYLSALSRAAKSS